MSVTLQLLRTSPHTIFQGQGLIFSLNSKSIVKKKRHLIRPPPHFPTSPGIIKSSWHACFLLPVSPSKAWLNSLMTLSSWPGGAGAVGLRQGVWNSTCNKSCTGLIFLSKKMYIFYSLIFFSLAISSTCHLTYRRLWPQVLVYTYLHTHTHSHSYILTLQCNAHTGMFTNMPTPYLECLIPDTRTRS